MVQKVNGSAYPGVWVEKQVAFVKLTFSGDISSVPAASLYELGTTTPVSAGTVADSSFGVVESALVQALKTLETKSTVLAISQHNNNLEYPTYFSATGGTSTGGLGTLVGGGNYLPGTYTNVPLSGGHGYGALATIVVNGATVVSSVVITTAGVGYASGDALTALPYFLGVASTPYPFNVLVSSASGTYGVTSTGNLITVGSTTGLTPGMFISAGAAGQFAPGTLVTSIVNGTQFTVNNAPLAPLSAVNSVIYGYNGSVSTVDVMLGFAEGWFSDVNGIIATGLPITNAQAMITVPGSAAVDTYGALVSVSPTAYTFSMEFVEFNGTLPVATFANGSLDFGPGASSGAFPTNSATGTPGYYPVDPYVS
jgi:hypothetical protein